MRKRKKYDWLWIIKDNHLSKPFHYYKKLHPSISEKRAARAFVMKSGINYKHECYEKDHLEKFEEYCMRIAQVDWIGD